MAEVNVNGSIDLNVNRGKRVNNNQRPRFKKDEHKPRVKTDEEYIAQLNAAMQKAGGRYVKFDNVDHTEGLMVAGVQSNDGKYMFADWWCANGDGCASLCAKKLLAGCVYPSRCACDC